MEEIRNLFIEKNKNLKLCFIKDNFAFFTKEFDNQWGDDWDDAPYQYNAGKPYEDRFNKIVKLAFYCPLLSTPAEITGIRPPYYSVEQINAGAVPWLTRYPSSIKGESEVYAGCLLERFIEQIEELNGEIYINVSNI